MKLLRTIRLDPSDRFVFDHAAEPGEWAVTGSFLFWDADPADLAGRAGAGFRQGFLGIGSFGFATLAVVSAASRREHDDAVDLLARRLHERLGAPSPAAARLAAAEEIAFAASLCTAAVNTIIAMERDLEGGKIRERFRILRPAAGAEAGHDPLHRGLRAFRFEAEPELAPGPLPGGARP